jgi:hypothetical protein
MLVHVCTAYTSGTPAVTVFVIPIVPIIHQDFEFHLNTITTSFLHVWWHDMLRLDWEVFLAPMVLPYCAYTKPYFMP